MRTTGSRTGSAPRTRSASARGRVSWTGRVITMRVPARTDGDCSTTRAIHLFQDCTRSGVNQQLRQTLPDLARLISGPGRPLPDVVAAVGRADDAIHSEFVAFKACPSAQGDLTTALQCSEKCPFGDDRLARFIVIERSQRV